jgi:hypothetical protein
MIDRTVINLISIIVGGAGIFTVLTGFHVPELNTTFVGGNLFAVKRDTIQNITNRIFTIVALCGLALQLWAEIWGQQLPDRLYGATFYMSATFVGFAVMTLLVWLLLGLIDRVARRRWEPELITHLSEAFKDVAFVVDHGGLRQDQRALKDSTAGADGERNKADNLRQAENTLTLIEKLLEISTEGDLSSRVNRLRKSFSK